MIRARLLISGLVTGVGFRSYARNNARSLGLKGYVKNLKSGRVEVVVEGYEKEINKLIELLKKGSFGSQVEDIDVQFDDPTNEFKEFSVLM
jgi:acylphosphatase